jgi:hypothetical protein
MRRQQKNQPAPSTGSNSSKTQLVEVTKYELRLLKLVRKMVAAEVATERRAHIHTLLKVNYRLSCIGSETPVSS